MTRTNAKAPLAPLGLTWKEWAVMDESRKVDPDEALAPVSPWWKNWDALPREELRGLIEAAIGTQLALADPLPDRLIADAQALGLHPFELRFFATDVPLRTTAELWSTAALATWARRYDFDRTAAFEGKVAARDDN